DSRRRTAGPATGDGAAPGRASPRRGGRQGPGPGSGIGVGPRVEHYPATGWHARANCGITRSRRRARHHLRRRLRAEPRGRRAPMSDDAALDGIGYAEALAELEGILTELEREAVDVDRLAERVQRAARLIRLCRSRIASAGLE